MRSLARESLAWRVGMAMSLIAAAGCSQDAGGWLHRMSEAYRAAGRYTDDGRVRIRYRRGETEVDHALPFRVAFERPDRIRVECYDARVVADGQTLRAALGGVPGQVLEEPVKTPLTLDQLFADPLLRSMLAEGEAGCPTQLALLLADDTVDLVLSEGLGGPRVAGREIVDGRSCVRVEIDKPDGTLCLWIDEATLVLRRLSLPSKAYAAFLTAQVGPVSGVEVVADFVGGSFDEPIRGEAFAFEVPPGARTVSAFAPLQSPDPPSELVGKPSPPFTLRRLDGSTVSRESLAGRIAVLEFFFDGCGPCGRSMPLVAAAIDRLRKAGRTIEHLDVSVDGSEASDDAVREGAKRAGAAGALARDPRSVAAAAFEATSFPTVVVIAPDGTVADLHRGPNDRIGEDITAVVEAIGAGRSTVELVRGRFEKRLADYRSAIDAAAGKGAAVLPEQVLAPKRQPDRFKLVRAWRSDAVDMPGNIVRVERGGKEHGGATLVVIDGWRSVVELGADGRTIGRHDLSIPEDAAVGFLRTALDAAGSRWWIGGAVGGQHLFVFDGSWKLVATYPEAGSKPHAGMSAAELVDGDGDGRPEIVVGYFGTVGVHGVSLEGKRIWKERGVDTVIHMAADAPLADGRRGVVVVDGRGRLVRISPEGVAATPVEVGGMRIQSLFCGPVGEWEAEEPAWSLLAIAGRSLGKTSAVGISPALSARWDLPLPDGIHRDGPIEPVAWADLLGSRRRQWIVAGADGSVQLLWDDGGLVGRYAHGEPIVGIAGFVDAGRPHVVIATRSAVETLLMDDIALD